MYIVTTTRLWRQWSICALVRSSSGLRSLHRYGTLLYGDEHMFFWERSIFSRMCEFVWSSRLFPYTLWFSLRLQFLAIVRASWRLGHMSQERRTPSKLGLYQQLSAKRAGICSGFFVSSSWKPFALQQLPQQLESVYLYARNWEWCAAIHRDFLVNTAYLGGVLEYWKLR